MRKGEAIANGPDRNGRRTQWDHGTHLGFYDYYASERQSEATLQRFRGIQAAVLRVAAQTGMGTQLDVADIGCGAGTQFRLWAERGHRVFGVDLNEPLIRLAEKRAAEQGLAIKFEVGAATALPWADSTMDVCLVPGLLEHVADWQSCLNETARVLRPGGLLYLSTTNVLCPRQQEFNLPLYSWYPGALKRYCEHLAVTTRPAIANYAKYPSVNWFSFYRLRDYLKPLGFHCLDRFDLIDAAGKGALARAVIRSTAARSVPAACSRAHGDAEHLPGRNQVPTLGASGSGNESNSLAGQELPVRTHSAVIAYRGAHRQKAYQRGDIRLRNPASARRRHRDVLRHAILDRAAGRLVRGGDLLAGVETYRSRPRLSGETRRCSSRASADLRSR